MTEWRYRRADRLNFVLESRVEAEVPRSSPQGKGVD